MPSLKGGRRHKGGIRKGVNDKDSFLTTGDETFRQHYLKQSVTNQTQRICNYAKLPGFPSQQAFSGQLSFWAQFAKKHFITQGSEVWREEGEEDEAVGESVARGVWSHEGRVSCPAPTTLLSCWRKGSYRQGLAMIEFLIM